MNGKLDRFIAGERGSNAWIGYAAFVVIVILSVLAIVCLAGCAAIEASKIEKLDDIFWEWVEKQTEKPPSVGEGTGGKPAEVQAGDELNYGLLKWKYGGFNGSNATLDPNVQISGLTNRGGKHLFYRWEKGLSAWGMSHTDHTGAICAAFFEKDGEWIGGKFDWVSTSRSDRELKHVEYYNNWGSSGIRLPWGGKVAFVVVSKDGRKRSNVLITGN
jgi:hypothetical protein